ncbi:MULTISPECIES: ribbon-helix-helix domain-containing protein [Sulfolobaceae]
MIISIKLDPDLVIEIDKLASERNITRSDWIREAIMEKMARHQKL